MTYFYFSKKTTKTQKPITQDTSTLYRVYIQIQLVIIIIGQMVTPCFKCKGRQFDSASVHTDVIKCFQITSSYSPSNKKTLIQIFKFNRVKL